MAHAALAPFDHFELRDHTGIGHFRDLGVSVFQGCLEQVVGRHAGAGVEYRKYGRVTADDAFPNFQRRHEITRRLQRPSGVLHGRFPGPAEKQEYQHPGFGQQFTLEQGFQAAPARRLSFAAGTRFFQISRFQGVQHGVRGCCRLLFRA